MSKKNTTLGRPRSGVLLGICAAALALISSALVAPGVSRQKAAPAPAATARQAALLEATGEVLKETGELRRLPPLRPVQSGVKTRAEIERLIIARLNEDVTREQARGAEATLRKFGLVDAAFRLRPFLVGLLTEQVAGYYDPRAREFYLADWIDAGAQKIVMSHELVHALQDQYFDLRRFERWPAGDSDAELAAQALIEGDATLTMMFYAARDPRRALEIFKSMLTSEVDTKQLDRAPKSLRATLLFPYEQGREWASAVYERGSWDLLSAAYRDLPQSSEQILHPEKYFAREKPGRVDLPDARKILGPGWRRIDYDVNGEWGYFLVLGEFIPEDEAQKAAAGWGADRYALYEHAATKATCLAHLSAWDSVDEAREFVAAYVKRTVARYKVNEQTLVENGDIFSLRTRDGEVIIERRDARVLIVEGVTAAQKGRMLAALRTTL